MEAPESTERQELCPLCLMWRRPGDGPCDDPDCPIGSTTEDRDRDVHLNLARANLMRLRGDYAQARELCLSVLKRFPGDHASHTLLGDIAAESGDFEQSAQWYEMALDVAPGSSVDRQKLEAVRQRIEEREAATTALQLGLPTTKPKALRFALATITFIVLVAVGAFYVGGWARAQGASDRVVRDTVSLDPALQPLPTATAAAKGEPQLETPAPAPPPVSEPADVDRATLDRVRAQCTHGAAVSAASLEPRSNALWLTVRVVDAASARAVVAELARSALRVFPEVTSVTVRAAVGEQVAFVADLMRSDLVEAETQGQEANDPVALLRNQWSAASTTTP